MGIRAPFRRDEHVGDVLQEREKRDGRADHEQGIAEQALDGLQVVFQQYALGVGICEYADGQIRDDGEQKTAAA